MESDLVTIEVVGRVPDTLRRIALLNAALFRVISGVRLIRVVEADYEAGVIRLLAESRGYHPRVEGRVCVRYQQASEENSPRQAQPKAQVRTLRAQ